MKKYIIGVLTGLMISLSINAFAKSNFHFTKGDKSGSFVEWNFTKSSIQDFVDDETGVHYLGVYDEDSLNSLCPRYNSDGTIMVDKKKNGK